MRRCVLDDSPEPILDQLRRAGFDLSAEAFGLWLQRAGDDFLVYQAEVEAEEAVLSEKATAWHMLPLVCEPGATVRRQEGR